LHNPFADAVLVGQYVALVGIIANVVLQLLNRRSSHRRQEDLERLIEENTRLTREAKTRASEAYTEANDVNKKIAGMRRDPGARTRSTDREGGK
jgi:predicted Holliday junction resolvase-like endonuclease